MSKYDELRMAVSSLITHEDAYWSKLHKVYGEVQTQFRLYLGLTSEVVIDSKGNKLPIVQTGIYDDQKKTIIPTAGFSLPKDGRAICFQILFNICSSESEDIQISKLIKAKVSRSGDEYYFDAEGLSSSVKCYEIDGKVDMTGFFEEIFSSILKKINNR